MKKSSIIEGAPAYHTMTSLTQENIATKNLVPLDREEPKNRYNTDKSFKVVLDVTDILPWNDIYDEQF